MAVCIWLIAFQKENLMTTKEKVQFAPYLNVKNATLPDFSADGSHIYYLSDVTGTLQVWAVPVEGGWADQVTFFEERVTSIMASPATPEFVITRDTGGDEQDQLYLLRGDAAHGVEITTLYQNPSVKNNFRTWRPDGKAISFSNNQRNPAFFDVYTQEIADGADAEPKLVYQGDNNFTSVAWSNSGRCLLIARSNTNLDNDLLLLDLSQPNTEPRLLTPHTGSAHFASANFSADDKGLYLFTDLDRDFDVLAYLDIESLEITRLAERENDVESVVLSPDGQKLAYTINTEGYSSLFIRQTKDNSEKEVSGLPRGTIANLTWSPQSDKLAFDFTSPIHNLDIWVYDVNSEKVQQVTHSARGGLNPQEFVMPELIKYQTFDGLQIPALWYLPTNAKKDGTTHVVVYVHGGPESQTRFAWNSVFQYLLQRGFAVLAPNVRGSSGYGKHYLSLDDVRKRMDSVTDLKYAVEWLHNSGYADPNKIVVWGGSYGGFMVLSAITVYPELWAAGVDIVGIANLLTFLENTSIYRRKLRTPEYGDPEVDRDFLIEASPIHKIDRITAPLMVLHGARDPRVPVDEAEQIVGSLRQRNHPVEYLRFEDEGHGITKLKNRLVAYPAIADFLEKYVISKGK